MAVIITRATAPATLVPGLKKLMFDGYLKAEQKLRAMLNVSGSTRAYEEWVGLTGVGASEEKAEGVGIAYKAIQQLTPKRVTMATWALGMRATMEAIQDDQYAKLSKLASILGKSFPVRQEIERANFLFNGAFGTWNTTGQDGLALLSASHPIKGAAFAPATTNITAAPARSVLTGSNLLPTASDLDYGPLIDAFTLSMRQVDEQGDYIQVEPKYLFVAPENWAIATELLKSTDRPDTANRSVSALSGLGITVVSSPYFLDTDAWILLPAPGNHDLNWFDRMAYTVGATDDFETGDSKIKGVERWGYGFADWRGPIGTPGA